MLAATAGLLFIITCIVGVIKSCLYSREDMWRVRSVANILYDGLKSDMSYRRGMHVDQL